MIQRDESSSTINIPTVQQEFTVRVEVDANQGPSPEVVALKIADGLAWVEGCGHVDVSYLGSIDPPNSNEGNV